MIFFLAIPYLWQTSLIDSSTHSPQDYQRLKILFKIELQAELTQRVKQICYFRLTRFQECFR